MNYKISHSDPNMKELGKNKCTVCLLGLTQSYSESEMSAHFFFLRCEESDLLPRDGDSFRTLSHQVYLEKETICT